jgi:aryl-alcohol dehydrogenase-like predicted oxidoreductase
LQETLERVNALKLLLRDMAQDETASGGMTLPELALRFILSNPDVSTTIPGMRKTRNVEANLLVSGRGTLSRYAPAYLPADLLAELRKHRWERKLTPEHLPVK